MTRVQAMPGVLAPKTCKRLTFAINLPHYPYQGDPKWLDHYRHLPYPRNLYAAFIATLDERIGALLQKVDDLGLRERTVVIFQSDNGHSVEERAHFGGGSAGLYRGAKFSLFEGGIRVPAIISWPGQLPEGQTRSQLAFGCDWFPTIAELCGIKSLPPNLDGKSLVPALRSANTVSPPLIHWQTGPMRNPNWAIRRGPWKLLGNPLDNAGPKLVPADQKLFLVNIEQDPGEQTNLADRQPDLVTELRRLHEEWTRGWAE